MGHSWDVLVLGGSSGVGKSTAAKEIERRLGISWAEVDVQFIGLLATTEPSLLPDVHLFGSADGLDRFSSAELLATFLRACDILSKAVKIAVEHHLETGHPAVFEGVWTTPEAAASLVADRRVRAVFICDDDVEAIFAAMTSRSARPYPAEIQRLLAELSWRHGRWLRETCGRLGLPVVEARPRASDAGRPDPIGCRGVNMLTRALACARAKDGL